MSFKRLRPDPAPPPRHDTPQCEEPVWKGWGHDRNRKITSPCSHPSFFNIDGKNLCRRHAQAETLRLLESGRLAFSGEHHADEAEEESLLRKEHDDAED